MTYGAVAEIVGPERRTDKKLRHENANLREDLLVSTLWLTDWRTRQAAIWADREHKALMAEVAF
jgi:hypothetical protein